MNFLLILGTLAVATQAQNIWTCTYSNGGVSYDLSKAQMVDSFYTGTDGKYNYDMQVCGIVGTADQCNTKGALICQYDMTSGNFVAVVASATLTPEPTWNLLDPTNPGGGVTAQFLNGDTCFISGFPRVRTANVNYKCGAGTPKTFTISEDANCVFTVNITGDCFCPGGCPSGSSSSLSGGWVFIIILVVVFPVYIVGGCIYKAVKQGTHGIESCPNIDFWKDLPNLIKDGFKFVFSGCKKGGDSSYDEL